MVANAGDNSTNTFETASQRQGPPRCWFTRDAQVWVLGCDTVAFAQDFANLNLRSGATAYGVATHVEANFQGGSAWASFVGFNGVYNTYEGAIGAVGPWGGLAGGL